MKNLFHFMIYCFIVISCIYAKCPCKTIDLCDIIKGFPQEEVFIFSLHADNAEKYDWSRITSIVEVGYHNSSVLCLAHQNNARVLSIANIATSNLTNAAIRTEWVNQQVQIIKDNYLDGINVDFESAIEKNETDIRDGLTALMKELSERLKAESENYMVSIDYAWSPNCIDSRCYDYKAIAELVDVAFIMAYDERSQIHYDCIAWANSPFNQSVSGIQEYARLGIPNEKMIFGVPWYGYMYPCINFTSNGICEIKPVPFRGVPCSDAAGSQFNYGSIEEDYLPYALRGMLWDKDAMSPYFEYKDQKSGEIRQVWFDDPKSLTIKYGYAKAMGMRGVGMWNADAIDYTNKDQINAMWGALPAKTAGKRAQENSDRVESNVLRFIPRQH